MLGLWRQPGSSGSAARGQGPIAHPALWRRAQEPSRAQQERGGLFYRGANRSAFLTTCFLSSLSGSPSSLIQPCPLVLSFATCWQIDTLAEMCSFCHSLWIDFFYYETSPTTPPFPSPFFSKLNRTMLPASQSSCGTSKSLVYGWEELDKFFLFLFFVHNTLDLCCLMYCSQYSWQGW